MIKGPIAQNTLRTSLVFGVRLLLQAGALVVLARVLGAGGFGAYVALGALAVVLGTLASFGTHLVLLRNISRDPSARDESLQLALGTSALCGSLLLVVYILLSVFWLRLPEVGFGVIVCIGVSELLLQPVLIIAAMERQGRGEIACSQHLFNLPLAFRLIAALLVGWLASTELLSFFAIGHLLAAGLALVIAVSMAPAKWPPPWCWRTPSSAEWCDASGYAFTSVSASGVAEFDKMLAGKLLTAGAAGAYVAASRVIGGLILPVLAMIVSAMPRLFREARNNARPLHGWILACSAGYGVAAGAGIWLLSPWLPLLFGDGYAGMGDVVRWLAWAVPGISLRAAASNVLTTLDRPWARVCAEMAGWLVLVILAWRLMPTLGWRGLALALVSTEWLLACSTWAIVWSSGEKSLRKV
ncbi:MAG: oligosaccharide flippase family protein [Lysobacteraceae bacterium]